LNHHLGDEWAKRKKVFFQYSEGTPERRKWSIKMALAENIKVKNSDNGDAFRQDVIVEYLPFVKQIVNRIAGHLPSHVDTEDLVHAGIIGLIQAVDRYDPGRNNSLKTYASFRIKGAVLSELRSRDYLSRTSRRQIRELEKAYMNLEMQNEGDVDAEAVADKLGVSMDEYHHIRSTANMCFISIDEIEGFSKDEKEKYVRSVMNQNREDALNNVKVKELRTAVAESISALPEKEKIVLSLYYMDELTMKEIGNVLELTESRVSQIHSKAIMHLRVKLRKTGFIE
jgi:RNA polymerase sigma factor FliA